jgi:transposase-like protein
MIAREEGDRMAAGKRTDGLTARGRAMQRVLARWERSGITLAEFARRAGMEPGTLAWWRHTLRAGKRTPDEGRFLELPMLRPLAQASRPSPATFEVVFGDGTLVRVPTAFDAGALDRLLAVVRGRNAC